MNKKCFYCDIGEIDVRLENKKKTTTTTEKNTTKKAGQSR